MRWNAMQVADALGVLPPAGLGSGVGLSGVSIDSRTVGPGELFFAIRGPRHDGHDHVSEALASGAGAAVVERERISGYPEEIRGRLFGVEDTLAALQQLARRACAIWRAAKPGRKIAGVAGSVGKTTTKEILAALLRARFGVLKTQGNLNNEYGLPLTLLGLSDEHDAAVVELGMSHRGELAQLTRIASPEVGVVTRVAVEHLEFFSSIDEIALAERELIENLPWPNATAVLNADDQRVTKFAEVARGPVIRFGIDANAGAPAEFRAENIEERGIEGAAFDFVWPGGRARLESSLIGRHNVMNAAAALAAASVWGIGAAEAKRVFPTLKPADKRGEAVRFEEDFTVINDTYNSSPTALNALVSLLAQTPGHRRRILAVGEMRELGDSSAELHRECGRAAAEMGAIDWMFGVTGNAAEFLTAAVAAGFAREKTRFFSNSIEAGEFLRGFVRGGDVLLLKGSRGVKMEKILEAIDAEHARKSAEPEPSTIERERTSH
jgi:UDP-N-acetylmuramoyl-tripeptide--D-alanyl-D-alanine ligase